MINLDVSQHKWTVSFVHLTEGLFQVSGFSLFIFFFAANKKIKNSKPLPQNWERNFTFYFNKLLICQKFQKGFQARKDRFSALIVILWAAPSRIPGGATEQSSHTPAFFSSSSSHCFNQHSPVRPSQNMVQNQKGNTKSNRRS